MNKEIFIKIVSQFSMTTPGRIAGLYDSLEYIKEKNLSGDFVECGVWRGGNVLGIAEYLSYFKKQDSQLWLYDTFFGMTNPTEFDIDLAGRSASSIIDEIKCGALLEEVKECMSFTSYPKSKIKYIVGDVTETLKIQKNIPEKISLLRLDTDFYESTKIELEVLWDKLIDGGVLIIDDYGHWSGCRKAVDDFFADKKYNFEFLDYTGIKIIK